MFKISVAADFSPDPGPRYARQGANSGETFRRLLVRRLREHGSLLVDLDGTSGMGSSFLDEAFGGLIRNEGFTAEQLGRCLRLKSDDDASYLVTIEEALRLARPKTAAAVAA